MSRIGNQPILIKDDVTVSIDTNVVKVKGPKGNLELTLPQDIDLKQVDNQLIVSRGSDDKKIRAKHGLIRSLVYNMVEGVSQGFSKKLEVNGVGFKINLSGKNLKLSLGFSHEINYLVPDDIDISVDGNVITISGIDKQRVGQTAADIRELKKPEPYKGKGIKYIDEYIIRKAGKSAATGEA